MRALSFWGLVLVLLIWVHGHAAPSVGELRLSGSGANLQGSAEVNDPDGLARDELRVAVASEGDYRRQGLAYTNFVRDLNVQYKRINRRRGEISISFPYAPVEEVAILLRLEWSQGLAWTHWLVRPEEILRASTGGAVVRIQAAPSRRQPSSRERPTIEDMEGLRIDTSRGDNWRNVADTVRQVYLRQEPINTEQVMLALRDRNPDAFTGPSDAVLRIGVSLVLPAYYDIQARNSAEARSVVRRLLARQIATRSRLELSPGAEAGRQAVLEERDAAKRSETETTQRLASVDTQLEQVTKLIELKQEQLSRIEEVAAQAEPTEEQSLDPSQQLSQLLNQRFQQLIDEARARPVFWGLAGLAILLAAIFLFLFYRLVHRRSLSPRARASLMRNLRRGQQRRSLFDAKEPEGDADRIAVPPPSRRSTQPASSDDRVQDDVTNANLDLARAYINMGEAKKARALLDAVLKDGTDAEKRKARKLLEDLD